MKAWLVAGASFVFSAGCSWQSVSNLKAIPREDGVEFFKVQDTSDGMNVVNYRVVFFPGRGNGKSHAHIISCASSAIKKGLGFDPDYDGSVLDLTDAKVRAWGLFKREPKVGPDGQSTLVEVYKDGKPEPMTPGLDCKASENLRLYEYRHDNTTEYLVRFMDFRDAFYAVGCHGLLEALRLDVTKAKPIDDISDYISDSEKLYDMSCRPSFVALDARLLGNVIWQTREMRERISGGMFF